MFATQRRLAVGLLVVAAAIGTKGQALGQRDGRGRPLRPEVRGAVKAVDASASTITVSVAEGRQEAADKTYALAKDVEVALGDSSRGRVVVFKEGKLTDLAAGTLVSLTLSADEKTVESIAAEGPTVRGLLKSVDAAKNTLAVTMPTRERDRPEEEKSYTVARDAEVAVDDGRGRRFSAQEAKLADLVPGAFITLRLSIDQKQVVGLLAEGPNLYGVVKAVDPSKFAITLALPPGRGGEAGEEKALVLSTDAAVLLDDGKGRRLSLKQGKLADVPAGAAAAVKLSADQKFVTMVRAEGPSMPGLLKAVDAANGTVTVLIGGRRDNAQEKTLPVAKDARIVIDGNVSKLADIKLDDDGRFAVLRLSLDQKTVQAIMSNPPR